MHGDASFDPRCVYIARFAAKPPPMDKNIRNDLCEFLLVLCAEEAFIPALYHYVRQRGQTRFRFVVVGLGCHTLTPVHMK
jgi:hypothetical protein